MERPEERRTVVTSKAEGGGARLTVKLSMTPRAGEQSLKDKYGVSKYDLGLGYDVPEALRGMIPGNVPDYVDDGENYDKRIMRALYYFKQCALIGPNATGKSVAEGPPVVLSCAGNPQLSHPGNLVGAAL